MVSTPHRIVVMEFAESLRPFVFLFSTFFSPTLITRITFTREARARGWHVYQLDTTGEMKVRVSFDKFHKGRRDLQGFSGFSLGLLGFFQGLPAEKF
ncbi:uncharacterized protein GGS22DRAFT_173650 [Annulohypoxylon maeteangense]|uniref:uncharacterized protein n=1 Tax=Annulohypoxylon maeteangense TaxID=1927788 RepID=UPI0020088FE1|nr:uncharacterized protein GGS22DRAFT_173650 [Annulohypoxylon maeteangense]KAI0880867.1 hypothetical protein GGS22DRAFT_173650 [Annulohypoxylon maeteangense]